MIKCLVYDPRRPVNRKCKIYSKRFVLTSKVENKILRSVSARLTGMGETPGKVPSEHLFRVGSLGRVGSLSKLASYTIWDREGSTLFSERKHSTEKTNWWELPVRFEQIYSCFPDLREELWLAAFGTSLWFLVLCRISLSPGLWVPSASLDSFLHSKRCSETYPGSFGWCRYRLTLSSSEYRLMLRICLLWVSSCPRRFPSQNRGRNQLMLPWES